MIKKDYNNINDAFLHIKKEIVKIVYLGDYVNINYLYTINERKKIYISELKMNEFYIPSKDSNNFVFFLFKTNINFCYGDIKIHIPIICYVRKETFGLDDYIEINDILLHFECEYILNKKYIYLSGLIESKINKYIYFKIRYSLKYRLVINNLINTINKYNIYDE